MPDFDGSKYASLTPGRLRLPPSRSSGADPFKLSEQIRTYGASSVGMPLIQVTRGARGELMINDGVTRATRLAKLKPRSKIVVEVIDHRLNWSLERLPRVRERI